MKVIDLHRLLPRAVQEELKEAARVDPRTPAGMSNERTKVLDRVIRDARQRYPRFFKER